ncbi:MAG: septum site determining protein [Nocardioidaceae bacterium]
MSGEAAPLLVTEDELLRAEVLRLAAAADVAVTTCRDLDGVRLLFGSAPLVMVGADLAAGVRDLGLSRRDGVVVVSRGEADFRCALELGATEVLVLPSGADWLISTLSDAGEGTGGAGVVLGFLSAGGGAGASTLAAAMAAAAADRWRTALVDLDPHGAGLEAVLGAELSAAGWSSLDLAHGRISARSLREALPSVASVTLLGWGDSTPRDPIAAVGRESIEGLRRGHDLVVVDLPRGAADPGSWPASVCDRVYVVAHCSLVGTNAGVRVVDRLRAMLVEPMLVARRGKGTVTPRQLAAALGTPLAATVHDTRQVAEQVDLGLGPLCRSRHGPGRAAGVLLDSLASA